MSKVKVEFFAELDPDQFDALLEDAPELRPFFTEDNVQRGMIPFSGDLLMTALGFRKVYVKDNG